MCGRFTVSFEAPEAQQELELGEMPSDWQPRYNKAPSQPVAVVADADQRRVEWMKWGLIPSWAKDPTIGSRMINARSETLSEKPSFRVAFARRRCLILANGFYEWQHTPGSRSSSTPYLFHIHDHRIFTFAGIWESWRTPEDEDLRTCSIITCAANAVVTPVHDRMPVIFDNRSCWTWLVENRLPELQGLLAPYPAEKMSKYAVSRLVNDPRQDVKDCIIPYENYANPL